MLFIGVAPESTLAREAGLELGMRGSIKVDATMRTSDPDIYAVGDAVEVTNVVTGSPALIALAGPANKQGRIAADNICGRESEFGGSQGSSVLKLFELDAASTGLTLTAARAAGIDADAVILSPANHATYYPGAETMTLKVVFERGTGRILGGQAIGRGRRGQAHRRTCRGHPHPHDRRRPHRARPRLRPSIFLCQRPGEHGRLVTIENILDGLVDQVTWDEALELAAEDGDAVLLDTRTAGEHARGAIEGALHIPVDELREHLDELPRDKCLLMFCASGLRSYVACRILSQHGFSCANVAGGYGFHTQVKRGSAVPHAGARRLRSACLGGPPRLNLYLPPIETFDTMGRCIGPNGKERAMAAEQSAIEEGLRELVPFWAALEPDQRTFLSQRSRRMRFDAGAHVQGAERGAPAWSSSAAGACARSCSPTRGGRSRSSTCSPASAAYSRPRASYP